MKLNTNDIELAPGWPIPRVERSLASRDSEQLVDFLRSRHQNRFFEPIKCLRNAPGGHVGYGFSIMSLCCLLIETIQCYREGVPTTNKGEWKRLLATQDPGSVPQEYVLQGQDPPMNGEAAFKGFFDHYAHDFPGINGTDFYRNIRNGLLHQAQTKRGWKINTRYSVVWHAESSSINRDLFADALKSCFDAYLTELGPTWNDGLWLRAARKIWWLIRLSRP